LAEYAQTEDAKTNTLLTSLVNGINQINGKLDTLIDFNRKLLKTQTDRIERSIVSDNEGAQPKNPDAMSLLLLPSSLRKTIMILYKREKATADEIAVETKRMRAVESAAANQLVRMGYLKKIREGRDVYFYIDSAEEKT
jgi:hypothetical protein